MDVLTLLKEDHDRVRELFRRYNGGGGLTGLVKRVTGNVAAREQRAALKKICEEFMVHAQVEEELFYPAVRGLGDEELRKQVDEGIEEHAKAKRQIASLRERLDEAENLASEVNDLQACIEHHATEEENEMFPRVEERMPDERRAELAREIRARKKSLGAAAPSSRRAARATSRRTTRAAKTAARARSKAKAKTAARARTTGRRKKTRTSGARGRSRKRA